ncbi:MAG: tRNA (5-methylaminomethyl-2-thiouridine)(34)-methyltransferase MnmD [Bacteroidia bacterium]
MKRTLFKTADGSHSIMVEELRESFHSQNGSIQESVHSFINAGLNFITEAFKYKSINIFEVGFGTGLNAILTEKWSRETRIKCNYHSIEAFPLENDLWQKLNYPSEIKNTSSDTFNALHLCEWNKEALISENFRLTKYKNELEKFETVKNFNVVFFDAFAPSVQPSLWKYEIFKMLFDQMTEKSVLVTYSAAAAPRNAMAKAGFWIEEIRGAAGKREMTRAIKW